MYRYNNSDIYHPAVPAPLLEKRRGRDIWNGFKINKKKKNNIFNRLVNRQVSLLPSRRQA